MLAVSRNGRALQYASLELRIRRKFVMRSAKARVTPLKRVQEKGCVASGRATLPNGPARTVSRTESDSVVFYYYSVVNLLRIVIHYSRYSKLVQHVVIRYIFSSESLRVVNSLQIVYRLRVLFLVCGGPLGCRTVGSLNDTLWLVHEESETKNYEYQYRKAKTQPKFSTSTGNNFWKFSGIF